MVLVTKNPLLASCCEEEHQYQVLFVCNLRKNPRCSLQAFLRIWVHFHIYRRWSSLEIHSCAFSTLLSSLYLLWLFVSTENLHGARNWVYFLNHCHGWEPSTLNIVVRHLTILEYFEPFMINPRLTENVSFSCKWRCIIVIWNSYFESKKLVRNTCSSC